MNGTMESDEARTVVFTCPQCGDDVKVTTQLISVSVSDDEGLEVVVTSTTVSHAGHNGQYAQVLPVRR